jgi:hypothetical protein
MVRTASPETHGLLHLVVRSDPSPLTVEERAGSRAEPVFSSSYRDTVGLTGQLPATARMLVTSNSGRLIRS